jgi:hypothetical protein
MANEGYVLAFVHFSSHDTQLEEAKADLFESATEAQKWDVHCSKHRGESSQTDHTARSVDV